MQLSLVFVCLHIDTRAQGACCLMIGLCRSLPATLVILGGPAALLSPEIVKKSGANGVAAQADQAVELANGLLKAQ